MHKETHCDSFIECLSQDLSKKIFRKYFLILETLLEIDIFLTFALNSQTACSHLGYDKITDNNDNYYFIFTNYYLYNDNHVIIT